MGAEITNRDTMTLLLGKIDSPFYFITKRLFDIGVSFISIIILLVPFIILGLVIFLHYHHNPIFADERIGKNGKIIHVYKFKTMVEDAESNPEKYLNKRQMRQWRKERKVENDPRETRFGRFLRRTSIDELPQFFNVLKGDMSIVGCRPITKTELEDNFNENEKYVFTQIRPGITGNWQVYDRVQATWESGDRKKYIMYYLKHRSLLFDFKLFLLTIPSCIKFSFENLHANKRTK